jgi:hypothetical protein
MEYNNAGSPLNFPRHNIPANEKNIAWGKQYAYAVWNDWSNGFDHTVFYNNGGHYEKMRLYAMGKQPIDSYKKQAGVDEQTNSSWLNVSWDVRPIVSRFRDRAISRLMKGEHDIVATPIDSEAKSKLSDHLAALKAKIAVRQLMQQQNPELAQHPMIQAQQGEPYDMEELEMRLNYGEQFIRSKDEEQYIKLAFYENDDKQFRRSLFEDLYDFGIGGYKEWLGEDNKAKFRKVNPESVITNYCRKGDFSDLQHAGEVIDVPLSELACVYENGERVFSDKQLEELAAYSRGKWGNPRELGVDSSIFKGYDKFKVKVLDLEFFSWNDYHYNMFVNGKGNLVFNKENAPASPQGKRKYKTKNIQVVYKIRWIVGTDYAYNFGLLEDMKRSVDVKKKAYTALSYKFFAYNFYEMRAQGIMERLIPLLDDYQMTMLKIQNFKNRAVPSGWWIDLDALESVALDKGGKNMEPLQLLDMFYQTGVLVGRSSDIANNHVNYKPVIPISNTAAAELEMFYKDLILIVQEIEATSGYNSITSGQANPKTLVPGYETAEMSTDDALYPVAFAETWLVEKLANDVMKRTQQGIKRGPIEGYAPAINKNSLTFVQVSEDIASCDYGIMLEEKSSEEQKAAVLQLMQGDIANGYLDSGDAGYILNVHNVKASWFILGYKVKKAKEKQQAFTLQNQQMTIQGQQQSAVMAEQAKQQTIQLEYKLKAQIMEREKQWDYQIMQLQLQVKDKINQDMVTGKVITQHVANEGKAQKAASE